MASPNSTVHAVASYPGLATSQSSLRPDEQERMETRRAHIQNYSPPKWKSSECDDVSGQHTELTMVDHASILITVNSSISVLLGTY